MSTAIAIVDANQLTLSIYDIPDIMNNEEIEEWIVNNTNHRISEISWGQFDGDINDYRNN